MPMWQRQITFAPVRLSGPISPDGLRVVEQDDVVGADQLHELARVRLERVLVDLPRRVVEVAAVALEAVEEVVDPLGDLEELGVALDHGPARVDAGALRVADQRQQQLHHAPALGGRADVPDRALAEQLAGGADAVRELLERLGLEHGLEALGRMRWDLDHFKHALHVPAPEYGQPHPPRLVGRVSCVLKASVPLALTARHRRLGRLTGAPRARPPTATAATARSRAHDPSPRSIRVAFPPRGRRPHPGP